MRLLILLLTLLGLAAAGLLVRSVGLAPIAAAMATMGVGGFALFTLYWLGMLVLLGLAWHAATPGVPPARAWLFVWGRTVREAASDVLPFSQFGGLVLGARTVAAHGVPEPRVHASMIVDITTEMAGQFVITLFGVATLALLLAGDAGGPGHGGVLATALGGLGIALAILLIFVLGQGPALGLLGRLGAKLVPGSAAAMGAVRVELSAIYRMHWRVALSFVLNFVAWIGSAAAAWIALRLMGAPVPLWAVLTIESLIFALKSIAFLIPGAIGVQEGAYILLAPIFGLDPGMALALSLVKRARDLAIGVPTLLVWQAGEARGILARRALNGSTA